ncbi:C45 family autoproteolytic acyltransferase/hydolase [Parasulfitobacter algicola]|uniref:Peptidase C45 hydrolase domain-containing protein n=1 Tax=Parasulfitobacter algicola TaxID=2614809 RepID=A0ABX2ILM0_9RHOB|nr:C45 family autoproteolytic acyltransferase/hydolase [Sulfitobacter algicola]NSX53445.1 hypothetical protein [Sulfitobacter algicola]
MSNLPEYVIDLNKPPKERWAFAPEQVVMAKGLLDYYKQDIGGAAEMADMLHAVASPVIDDENWQEYEAIATQLGVSTALILLANAYYDVVKTVLGCTTFAIDTDDGPLHGRNLDWWTDNRILNDGSGIYRYKGADAGEFISIGWPGYTGVISGMAPGRFSITMNAVLSSDPVQIKTPIPLQIRHVFERSKTFDEAVATLTDTALSCDALLLVTGTKRGEMVVIERTPNRSAVRHAEDGKIHATNNYIALDANVEGLQNEIQLTSCARYDRMGELLRNPPASVEDCMTYLSEPGVQMEITVQQMAFRPLHGHHLIEIP